MEDETTKEDMQPSTSKKDNQRTNSGNDLNGDRERDEGASNSETSGSTYYHYSRSRGSVGRLKGGINIVDARPEPPKPNLGKRVARAPERRKRVKRAPRVDKRRRSYRRQLRKAPMRKRHAIIRDTRAEGRRPRDKSRSTIFTRLSSQSGSPTPRCIRCGHRCCRRRYEYEVCRYEYMRRRFKCRRCGRVYRRMSHKRFVVAKRLKKKPRTKIFRRPFIPAFCKGIQTGSRSNMLSPLFINTNSTLETEMTLPPQTHCEVTPEMIFESLSVLNLWRQEVQTIQILEYLRRNYPVNNSDKELSIELLEKLRIASIVGIVTQTEEDFWALSGELEQRRLTANHVTLFWQAYTDTLRPIPRKEANLQKERSLLPSKTTRGTDCGDDVL